MSEELVIALLSFGSALIGLFGGKTHERRKWQKRETDRLALERAQGQAAGRAAAEAATRAGIRK